MEEMNFTDIFNNLNDDLNDMHDTVIPDENEEETSGNTDTLLEEENENSEEELQYDTDSENKEEEEETTEDTEEMFTVKFNGETKELNREDIIKFAQKGMNYDRVSEKWNAVKDNVDDWREAYEFLEEMSKTAKVDVPTLMENFRVREFINKSKANGDTITEKTARKYVQEEQERKYKERKPLNEEEKKAKETKEHNDRQKKHFNEFCKEYPDIEAKDIPKEVWDDYKKANGEKTLLYCYEKWDLKRLREEKKNSGRTTPKSTKPLSKKNNGSYESIIGRFNDDL